MYNHDVALRARPRSLEQLALAKFLTALMWAMCALASSSALDPAKLVGEWFAPAEDADDVDAIITLSMDHGVWRGHIKTIKQTRPDQKVTDSTLCTLCTGVKRGQPYKGLEVIWGLREKDGVLQSGEILDPGDGQVYDCEMRLSPDGKTLHVRAFKGLRVLGHEMVWVRP